MSAESSSEEEFRDDADEEEDEEYQDEEDEEYQEEEDDGEEDYEEEEEAGDDGGDDDGYDDSDDVPIAQLKKKPTIKIRLNGGGSGGKKRTLSEAKTVTPEEGDDDGGDSSSDSDDDIPLAELAKKKKKKETETKNGKKKKVSIAPAAAAAKKKKMQQPPKKKAKPIMKRQDSNVSTASTSNKIPSSPSAALYNSDSVKGKLVQNLLCRWWYAITWPDPSTLPDTPPENYDSLDGFPGVYVATSGDKVGQLLDLRDAGACPSFQNMAAKSSEELQQLLLKALEEQKKQLREHEGPGTSTEKQIDTMYKWAQKVKPARADKEAIKVLKAAGF